MYNLERKFRDSVELDGVICSGDRLLVGVSGGADSMGLLHLLDSVKDDLDLDLTVVYVDHGLRPLETGGERTLVETAAAGLGAGFSLGIVDVAGTVDGEGLSVEEAARELRYAFFAETAEIYNCTKIVVAHTADDQAEELLLRLIRGTGRNGLSGMAPINFRQVVRPLLQFRKAEIVDYLGERNITYLEDSSNGDRTFLRNRVRLDLIPYLAENFNPAITETLLRTADILRAEDELLAGLADEVYNRVVTSEEEPDYFVVDCPALAGEGVALQRRVLERVLTDLSSVVTFRQVAKILELVREGKDGAELHLSQGLRVIRKDMAILLYYPAGRTNRRGSLIGGDEGFTVDIDGVGTYPVERLAAQLVVSVIDTPPDRKELMSVDTDYLDMRSFEFPLQVRNPRQGDRFRPLGGPGSRKVADFLSDRKMSRDHRKRVPVLAKNDDVLALLTLRIDERYKLVADSAEILKVQIIPLPEKE